MVPLSHSCNNVLVFLNPLDKLGKVDPKLATNRRILLMSFKVVEKVARLLHGPLVEPTGEDLATARDELQQGRTFADKGASLLEMLWQRSLAVLASAGHDYLAKKRTGVKLYLSQFFRTFALHLIYFGSAPAGDVLKSIILGRRDILDGLLKDATLHGSDLVTAGEFRWLLSFVQPKDSASRTNIIGPRFYSVLETFCASGLFSVERAQAMIGQALSGKERLVGDVGSVQILLPFDRHEDGQKTTFAIEPSYDEAQRAAVGDQVGAAPGVTRSKVGLKSTSAWERRVTKEGQPYFMNTATNEITFAEPPDSEYTWVSDARHTWHTWHTHAGHTAHIAYAPVAHVRVCVDNSP
jgi:hypothetical protein